VNELMTEPSDDNVLDKLDALLKRHQRPDEHDIPVLTDIVTPPQIDLNAIPVLTEEVSSKTSEAPVELDLLPEVTEVAPAEPVPVTREAEPLPSLPDLEFEPMLDFTAESRAPEEMREPLDLVVGVAPAEAAIEMESTAEAPYEIEIPPAAAYIDLTAEVSAVPGLGEPEMAAPESVTAAAPQALSQQTVQLIADTVKIDIAKIIDEHLQHALAQQLKNVLHVALDRALASMLDQFVVNIEEVVRASIADELQKQLAPFKRPSASPTATRPPDNP
jgi:hypothetical protein